MRKDIARYIVFIIFIIILSIAAGCTIFQSSEANTVLADRWSKKWQDMEREAGEDSLDKIKIVIRKSFPSLFKDKKIKVRNYIFESSINMSTGITWQYKDGGILLQIIGPHNFTLSNP